MKRAMTDVLMNDTSASTTAAGRNAPLPVSIARTISRLMPHTIIPSMPITRSASDGPRSRRKQNSGGGQAEHDVGGGDHRRPCAAHVGVLLGDRLVGAERPHGEVGEVQDLAADLSMSVQVQHVDVQHDRVRGAARSASCRARARAGW